MCGIAGWLSAGAVDRGLLESMGRALAHRGPDGEGVWISPDGSCGLVHRRLSIIDLSPNGVQPIVEDDGRAAFVHNGEIYNFHELREELRLPDTAWRSRTDSEVACRTLMARGESAVESWEGMFAVAFWEGRSRSLLLARDRFGIKPLYWARRGGDLYFASELKALLRVPTISRNLDLEAAGDYFSYGYVPFDRCIVAGVSKLPPGHLLVSSGGREQVRPYWGLERKEEPARAERFREALDRAVRTHMVADVPVGAFLSGGLDSGYVTAAMRKHLSKPVETFTLAYRGGGQEDVRYASMCARLWETNHHEMTPGMADPVEAIGQAARFFDEPVMDSTALAVFELARETRKFVKVVLSGDGGDEAFGGYGWHQSCLSYERAHRGLGPLGNVAGALQGVFLRTLYRLPFGGRLSGIGKILSSDPVERYFLIRGLMDRRERASFFVEPPRSDPDWLFRKFYRLDFPLTHRLLFLDLMTYLPDNNLALVDRASMAHGLEVRVPLLDRALVEYAFSLPESALVTPSGTKILFRTAIADLLPPELLSRRKYGFSPPFKDWMRGANLEPLLRRIEEGYLVRGGVIRKAALRQFIERRHPRRFNKLWAALVFEEWYRRWIAQDGRALRS